MASLSSGPEIEVVPEGAVDSSAARSALEESILAKGKNSYYYAHKNNLGVGGDQKNYGTPPRLLKTTAVEIKGTGRPLKVITDYAWSDCGKKVKVYVTIEGIVDLTDDSVVLEHTKTSFNIRLNGVKTLKDTIGKDYVLDVPKLNDEIQKVTFKLKQASNKIVISLTKENDFSWYDLKKA